MKLRARPIHLRLLALPGVLLLSSWSQQAEAAETFDAYTLSQLVNQSVNVMAAHQRLQRAQTLTHYNTVYFGIGARGAPASYRMSDGTVLDEGLARVLLSVGGRSEFGKSGAAVHAGVQVDMAAASGFPNILGPAGGSEGKGAKVVGFFSEALAYAGGSYSGLSLSAGVLVQSMKFDADPAGRFVPYGYPADSDRNFRPGTPTLTKARQGEQYNHSNYFITLDHEEGYMLGGLIGQVERIRDQGQSEINQTLAALRAMAQPYDLIRKALPKKAGLPGLGLNRYAEGLDYYGDRFKGVQNAVARGEPLPATASKATYEVPIVWDRIAGTPFSSRIVTQVQPEPLFRLAEVSVVGQADLFVGGARAMVFKRGEGYTGSVDTFAGIHAGTLSYGAGFGFNVSYSYNSPDMATFLPLPNAHVIGMQLMMGLPEAMPPPVPIARDPLEERKAARKNGGKP